MEGKTTTGGEVPVTEETNSENATEGDPLKKELEAKNREVIDLKVCLHAAFTFGFCVFFFFSNTYSP